MIKIDLQKAYDLIQWKFIECILHELGFSDLFVRWVMECISFISYSILLNGKPLLSFQAAKGLRLGDPMSFFLFALCMEYLSRCLDSLKDKRALDSTQNAKEQVLLSCYLLMIY